MTDPAIHVGITGSQQGISFVQKYHFMGVIMNTQRPQVIFHHGCCIGADKWCHDTILEAKRSSCPLLIPVDVICHPPLNKMKMADCPGALEYRQSADYLVRNSQIVGAVECLYAYPKTEIEEIRSGTWATIRQAIKQKVALTIVYPSGKMENHFPDFPQLSGKKH